VIHVLDHVIHVPGEDEANNNASCISVNFRSDHNLRRINIDSVRCHFLLEFSWITFCDKTILKGENTIFYR